MVEKYQEKNIILVDWFAMSYRREGITPYEIIESLGFKEEFKDSIVFKEMPGRYMYKRRISFGNIHIYFDNINPDCDYPMLEMTGQGCREFETFSRYSFEHLFELAKDTKNYHMTRLDIAFDDHTGIFDIKQIEKDYRDRNWVSKSTKGRITVDVSRQSDAISIMTGTKSSDMYMRIYDKAAERGIKDGRHWIRCELVLKQDRAVQFIMNNELVGKKFRGVIYNYFRFVTPSDTDRNKRRWEMRDYWRNFLENVEKISVYTPKDIEYNLCRLNKYVFGQAGNSIDTYIKCVGLIKFLDDLVKRSSQLNAKQRFLIEESKALIEMNEAVDESVLEELSSRFKQ